MKPTRKRLVKVAAVLSTIAIAAPMSTAAAATAAPAAPGQGTTVIGPTFTTTAPATFINTNNQVSPGGNTSGNQVAR
jgi:curli biogenesis system outer membrane secretion channel CsgG